MTVKQIKYENTDEQFSMVLEFLNRAFKQNEFLLWDPGRMNFWRYSIHGRKKRDDGFFPENARLWVSGSDIVGMCISEYGEDDIFIEALPDYDFIYPRMFEWTSNVWGKGKDSSNVDVFSSDMQKIKILEANGYKFKCHYENRRTYYMDEVELQYKLPEGFRIMAFHENPQYQNRVDLVKSAFNNEKYSIENLKGIHSSNDYIKDLDLVVESPDGIFTAYCIGWFDAGSENSGYIEPVGTHKEFRRMGLASSIIRECFGRMREKGIRTVCISSGAEPNPSNFLYEYLGPKIKKEIHRYSKDINVSQSI